MNDLLQALRLKHLDRALPELCEHARLHSLTHEAFLRRVLTLEIEARKLAAQQQRLHAAKLPERKTLEAFDFAFQPALPASLLWGLAELAFVKAHTNVVLLGPPGVGKIEPTPKGGDRLDRRSPPNRSGPSAGAAVLLTIVAKSLATPGGDCRP